MDNVETITLKTLIKKYGTMYDGLFYEYEVSSPVFCHSTRETYSENTTDVCQNEDGGRENNEEYHTFVL